MSDELLQPPWFLRNRILLFIASGIILLIGIGNPPVSRTQEARVLETARQMLGQPTEKWLIPELNGDVRLQKPPFAYWYTALSLRSLGETEFAGRLPTALLAWATILITYLAAAQLFDPKIGVLSSAMLMGGYLFARHSRLAETDLPATLFTTLAVLSVTRAMKDRTSLADLHVFAIAVGLAILAKGGPAIFSILFVSLVIFIERRWDLIARFFTSGAIVTLAAIAVPWFVYVAHQHGVGTFLHELRNTAEGGDHSGSVFEYLAVLAWGAAPWSAVLPFAIFDAIRRWKINRSTRICLLWIIAIAIPLILNGNKQKHYLLPLLPALMLLSAWWIVEIWKQAKLARIVAFSLAGIVPLIVTLVVPHFVPDVSRRVAERIGRMHGREDLRFYGDNFSPVLSFNMRKKIPIVQGDLSSLPRDATLLVIGKKERPAVEPPGPFVLIDRFEENEQTFAFYQRR
jgi:4-amino-4-deoxy-L-arabinose transferase-like glycosyltransferase